MNKANGASRTDEAVVRFTKETRALHPWLELGAGPKVMLARRELRRKIRRIKSIRLRVELIGICLLAVQYLQERISKVEEILKTVALKRYARENERKFLIAGTTANYQVVQTAIFFIPESELKEGLAEELPKDPGVWKRITVPKEVVSPEAFLHEVKSGRIPEGFVIKLLRVGVSAAIHAPKKKDEAIAALAGQLPGKAKRLAFGKIADLAGRQLQEEKERKKAEKKSKNKAEV